MRNVRTAVTGAECAGRYASYEMAKADGIELTLEWQATLDNKTRHSHAVLDGQRREVGEPFEVDGVSIMFPGDVTSIKANDEHKVGSMIYNCRCTIKAMVKKYAKYHERGKYGNGKLGDETYDEWKERHIAALEKKKSKGVINMSNVEFTSHRGEVMDEMEHAVRKALTEIGISAENHAKTIADEKGVHDTGALINSITWAVGEKDGQPAVYIGTNKHYAIFQELGTSIYNPKSPTSKPFWYYKDEFGKWHKAYP